MLCAAHLGPSTGYAHSTLRRGGGGGVPRREQEALPLIHANASDFESRGEGMEVTLAHWAAAALYNGLARYDDAFAAAEEALVTPGSCGSPRGRPSS
jgi:hypothetical protein